MINLLICSFFIFIFFTFGLSYKKITFLKTGNEILIGFLFYQILNFIIVTPFVLFGWNFFVYVTIFTILIIGNIYYVRKEIIKFNYKKFLKLYRYPLMLSLVVGIVLFLTSFIYGDSWLYADMAISAQKFGYFQTDFTNQHIFDSFYYYLSYFLFFLTGDDMYNLITYTKLVDGIILVLGLDLIVSIGRFKRKNIILLLLVSGLLFAQLYVFRSLVYKSAMYSMLRISSVGNYYYAVIIFPFLGMYHLKNTKNKSLLLLILVSSVTFALSTILIALPLFYFSLFIMDLFTQNKISTKYLIIIAFFIPLMALIEIKVLFLYIIFLLFLLLILKYKKSKHIKKILKIFILSSYILFCVIVIAFFRYRNIFFTQQFFYTSIFYIFIYFISFYFLPTKEKKYLLFLYLILFNPIINFAIEQIPPIWLSYNRLKVIMVNPFIILFYLDNIIFNLKKLSYKKILAIATLLFFLIGSVSFKTTPKYIFQKNFNAKNLYNEKISYNIYEDLEKDYTDKVYIFPVRDAFFSKTYFKITTSLIYYNYDVVHFYKGHFYDKNNNPLDLSVCAKQKCFVLDRENGLQTYQEFKQNLNSNKYIKKYKEVYE